MENKMTKVGVGHEREIIIADNYGDAKASGVKIGYNAINSTPNNNTVATEAAVVDYVSNSVIKKEYVSTSNNLPTDVNSASDEKVISEKSMFALIERSINDTWEASY